MYIILLADLGKKGVLQVIEYLEGDIFCSPAQVIVNTVNTVGVMGKGLALSFKKRYPEMFEHYRKMCERKLLSIGKLMLCYAPDHWILLFPTKEHWRNPSKLSYIEAGLSKFVKTYAEKSITSIAFPRLGCGNGELNWEDVRPLMEKYLESLPIDVYIYLEPGSDTVPEHKSQDSVMDWLRENAKDMSFNGLVDDIKTKSALIPYEFPYDGCQWSVIYKDGLEFSMDDKYIIVDEDAFFSIWDEIRSAIVFNTVDDPRRSIIYSLLESLGYLSPIRRRDSRSGEMSCGFQLNGGLGRAYALRGCHTQ